MPVSLELDNTHKYTEATDGNNVPITLAIGSQPVDLLAKLDTGAAHCIFERKYAEILGLEVESGFNVFGPWLDRSQPINTRSPFRPLALSFRRLSFSLKIRHSAETSLVAPVGLSGFASALWTTTGCSS